MTIRLLCAQGKYPANAIIKLDAGTEAGLVAAKQATTDLTGGTRYVEPEPAEVLSLVYGIDGRPAILSARPKLSIFGDSQIKNAFIQGITLAPATPIPGISTTSAMCVSSTTPLGDCQIDFDFPGKRLRYAAPGESFGSWVDVKTGGVFDVPSDGASGSTLRVYCRAREYTTSVTTTAPVALASSSWIHLTGSIYGMIDALTAGAVDIAQPVLGVPGDTHIDALARFDQVLAQGASVILGVLGTNTLLAQNLPPETVLAQERELYSRANAAGRVYISSCVFPRFGVGGSDPLYTAANCRKIFKYNALLQAEARKNANWFVLTGDYAADMSNEGRAKTGTTGDGLHGKSGLFLGAMRQLVGILNALYPASRASPKLGSTQGVYNASDNPGGNLINSGAGSFVGVNAAGNLGVGNAGVALAKSWASAAAVAVEDVIITAAGYAYRVVAGDTLGTSAPVHSSGVATNGNAQLEFICAGASTGIAANWTFIRSSGSAVIGRPFKYVDADGEGQAVFITSTVDNETIQCYCDAISPANFASGDIIDAGVDFNISGVGSKGAAFDINCDGNMVRSTAITAAQMNDNSLGVTGKFTPRIPPGLVWDSTGVTFARYRIYMRAQAGSAFLVKLSNAYMRKVI